MEMNKKQDKAIDQKIDSLIPDEMSLEQKTQVILRHTQLASEYSELSKDNGLMTAQEWRNRENRKAEIILEIDSLRAVESSWSEAQGSSIDDRRLKTLTREEVAKLLHTTLDTITMYIEIGMLRPVKVGRSYLFLPDDVYSFLKTYEGKDISNREKCLKAFQEVNYEQQD